MGLRAEAARAARFKGAALVLGVAASLLGLSVLIGWVAGVPAMASVLPGLATMKPNTAFAFVLSGAALALAARGGSTKVWMASRALAGITALIGALTVAEYLFGVDLGIDNLLFSVPIDPAAGNAPRGRMALATASAFTAIGAALLLIGAQRSRLVAAQVFAVLGGLVGLLAVLGYMLDVRALYAMFMYSSVAVHTALGLLAVASGALLARPDAGIVSILNSASLGGTVIRNLLPFALLAPLVIAFARQRAEMSGLVPSPVATAIVNMTYMVLFTALILRLAHVLNRLDDERVRAHDAETKQRLQFNGIIETAMDAVVVVDSQQRIVVFNSAAETMFLRKAPEVLGRTLDAILPPGAWVAHAKHVRAFGQSETEGTRRMGGARPVTGIRSTGEEFPIEASISKLEVHGERYYTSILRDITQRRRTEAARDEAERASRTKSSFLANMSHEIRTPLNAIIGLTHLLHRDNPTAIQAQRLDKIDAAGLHLLSLISDILDISKIESGQMVIEQTDFHLSSILDNVASIIGEQAREKGIRVSLDPDAVPMWLRGDPTRLRQALLNYASNALKFTRNGSIEIRAQLLHEADAEVYVRFEVEDTGVGIAPEQIGRLFTAFEQADSSTTREYGGTGLGLAITKNLALLMGGDAGARSEPGRGSTFWFTARLARGHGVMPAQPQVVEVDVEHALRVQHAGRRILLAEDNDVNREVAFEILHAVGLAVDAAQDGEVAFRMARATPYDLILMDMQMPRLNGIDASRAIRALPDRQDVPIIALTANAFGEDRHACTDAGMNDFVSKPVEPTALYRTLLTHLRRAPVNTASDNGPRRPTAFDLNIGEALREISGLDATFGLRLLRGDVERYRSLVERMSARVGDQLQALDEALRAGNLTTAHALVHAMEGSAGTVGATALHRALSDLTEALRVGSGTDRLLSLAADARQAQAQLSAALRRLPQVVTS